ncbi:MAG: ABC transporter ATP-binding protein [Nanoarchaeota archaeon]|nr:ABC transporter ATP-binding protein [Nanoarchaeota archaeon]MBU1945804.1 ABC transporter ATP-binding protein [Nanoarchaeota archaeon]
MEHLLEVKNISVQFPLDNNSFLEVIKNVNLTVLPGESVAIIGLSGCGKSTLLKVACGLIKPNIGEVLFKKSSVQSFFGSGELSYIPQEALLLPNKTVVENIIFPISSHRVKTNVAVNKLLSKLKLSDHKDFYPKQLSGGLKQRVSLGRALVSSPSIIFMDEPFSSLDQFTRDRLGEDLIGLRNKFKTSLVLVTHNIEEAVFLSDRIIILSQNPASIVREIKINLPSERNHQTRRSDEYLTLTKQVRLALDKTLLLYE